MRWQFWRFLEVGRLHAVIIVTLLVLLCPIGFLLILTRLNCGNLFKKKLIFINLFWTRETVMPLKLELKRSAVPNFIANLKGD